jgi:hypothetical protein
MDRERRISPHRTYFGQLREREGERKKENRAIVAFDMLWHP